MLLTNPKQILYIFAKFCQIWSGHIGEEQETAVASPCVVLQVVTPACHEGAVSNRRLPSLVN